MLIPRLSKPDDWSCDTYAFLIGWARKVSKLAWRRTKFTEVSAAPLLCELPTGASCFLASMLKVLHALTTESTRLARPPRDLPPLCPASKQWINFVALSWASSNVRFWSPSALDAYPGQLKSCLVQSLHVILLDVGPDVIPWQRKRGTSLQMGSERDNAQRPDLCRGGSTSFCCSTGFVQSPAVPRVQQHSRQWFLHFASVSTHVSSKYFCYQICWDQARRMHL